MTLLLLFTYLSMAAAGAQMSTPADVDAAKAFGRMKTLEGRWQSAGPSRATVTFELVGGGSTLVERYANPAFPGGGHMLTAYHLDGGSLMLAHYCIANNQPVMRAERFDETADEIQFEFVRAANLPDEKAAHMRRARYRITSPDTFVTEWELFANGRKVRSEAETFTRAR